MKHNKLTKMQAAIMNGAKTTCAIVLLAGFVNISNAQPSNIKGKLEYMYNESPEKIFEIARTQRKPVLMYINSQTCFSSRKFSREIMSQEKVKSLVRTRFISMNADVSSKYGRAMATQHKIFMLPAIVLYSPDKGIVFQCHLKIDTLDILSQLRSFIVACNLMEQVALNQSTTNLTERESLKAIGRSYANLDFKRHTQSSVDDQIKLRTLNMDYFNEFAEGYKEEWKIMVATDGRKNSSSVTISSR